MKIIKLTNGGKTIVDEDVYEWASKYNWRNDSDGYAVRKTSISGKAGSRIFLHHAIIGYPLNGLQVDHINGNRLDNQRSNLRIVTRRENQCNRRIHREGRLPGCYHRKNKTWQAAIKVDGKIKHLGTFATEQEAHDKYMEEFSKLKQLSLF